MTNIGSRGLLRTEAARDVLRKLEKVTALLVVAGWLSYAWSLGDIDRYSVTLLLLASVIASAFALRASVHMVAMWPLLLSTVFSFLLARTADTSDGSRPLTHLGQQMLCMCVASGVSGFHWESCLPYWRKTLTAGAVVATLYGAYQLAARILVLPFAYLSVTNIQLEADGFQRGIERGMGVFRFTRASSLFTEPSDFGLFGLWILCFGLGRRIRVVPVVLGVAIILLAQSLGAFIGVIVVVFAFLLFGTHRVRKLLVGLALTITVVVGAYAIVPDEMISFSNRLQLALQLDIQADSARISRLPSNVAVILQKPWAGYGLGNNRIAEPNGIALGLVVLAVERGFVGTVLFLGPFLWTGYKLFHKRKDSDATLQTIQLLYLTNVYAQFAWFANLYFPLFWISYGMALWATDEKRLRYIASSKLSGRAIALELAPWPPYRNASVGKRQTPGAP